MVTPGTTFSRTSTTFAVHFTRSPMLPKTGPLHREALEPALHCSGMTAQDFRALLRNSEWQELASRNSQAVSLSEFTETESAATLRTDGIAKIFNIRDDHVRRIRYRARMKRKGAHRPLTLDAGQEADIVRFICERFGSRNYVTQIYVREYIEAKFRKVLTYGWMRKLLDRHECDVCRVTVTPQAQVRLEVPRSYLDDYLLLIKKIVPIVPTELRFNLDETGLSD